MSSGASRFLVAVLTLACLAGPPFALAQDGQAKPFEPVVGQAGKDVVWVPTPPELVEKMLDLAKVTPKDYVIDLGSGDGRNVIAAAKRGARSLGVEYNPDMVALSKRSAEAAGVASRASFVQGDMYVADISKATALALFLLPSNMFQLKEKFLALAPGTRIVSNTFGVEGWEPDGRASIEPCSQQWCTALLWIVPAKVDGTWRAQEGEMILEQEFQYVTGALGGRPVADGKLSGGRITFTIGMTKYDANVSGDSMEGTSTTDAGVKNRWTARRSRP
jgi:SAM-dependent methyltransferase